MSEPSERLDTAILKKFPNYSRSLVQKLIKNGHVTIDGVVQTKTSFGVKDGMHIDVKTDILAEKDVAFVLDIIYEDENCVVINKPIGLLTHSKGAYNPEITVASWLKKRNGYDFPIDNERGGIVHRLDRATSGVMICAKNKATLGMLQKQFQIRKTKKAYVARVKGLPDPPHAVIDLPIERNPNKPQTFRINSNGKEAQTEYEVIQDLGTTSLVELKPRTGRTHQLRVHMHYVKHPIVGDVFYNGQKADRLYLHAKSLEITLPGGIRKIFISETPKQFFAVDVL